jgi:hypothetical protein
LTQTAAGVPATIWQATRVRQAQGAVQGIGDPGIEVDLDTIGTANPNFARKNR